MLFPRYLEFKSLEKSIKKINKSTDPIIKKTNEYITSTSTCSAPFIFKFTQKNKQNGRHNPLTSKTLARLILIWNAKNAKSH